MGPHKKCNWPCLLYFHLQSAAWFSEWKPENTDPPFPVDQNILLTDRYSKDYGLHWSLLLDIVWSFSPLHVLRNSCVVDVVEYYLYILFFQVVIFWHILAWVLCNMFCHLYCISYCFAESCTYCCLQVTQGTKLVLYLQVTGSMRRTGMLSITGCQYCRVADQTATYCSTLTCKICCIWDWALQSQWNRWFWITQIYVKTYLSDS